MSEKNGSSVPYNEIAEHAVLGSFLIDPSLFEIHGNSLRTSDFFSPPCRRMFVAMTRIIDSGKLLRIEELQPLLDPSDFGLLADAMQLAIPAKIRLDIAQILQDGRRRARLVELDEERAALLLRQDASSELQTDRWATIDSAELDLDRLPTLPPFLIEGLFHQKTKLVLGGASKGLKTWSLIDMALSVASGSKWWGFQTVQAKVLYVNFEIPKEFFEHRVATLKKTRGIGPDRGMLQMIHLRGERVSAESFRRKIEKKFAHAGFSLMIIDPQYKLMIGQEENSTGTLSALADVFDGICASCNTALAYGAHFSKGNQASKESVDRISGSGVTARDPDTILTLTKHEEDNCSTLEAVLRNCPPIDPKVMRWNFPIMEEALDLDPQDLKKTPGRPAEMSAEQLLELLPKPLSDKEWKNAAAELGCSERTFYRKKSQLINNKSITQTEGSRLWIKT